MQERINWKRLAGWTVGAAVVGAVVNEVFAMVAVRALEISPEFLPLGPGAAAISTVVGTLGAGGVMAAVARFSRRPGPVFLALSTAALLLSFVPNVALARNPAEIPGTTLAAVWVLAAMHLVAYAIAVPAMLRAIAPAPKGAAAAS